MPKQFRAQTTTTKRKRQALMAAIIFAMSPMLAQTSVSAEGTFTRPPLPLNGTTGQPTGSSDVKVNPFCMPVQIAEATPIQLASGTESSNVRLQPIGAAIGLHKIGKGAIKHRDTPAITVEAPVASEVQSNPLVDQPTQARTETKQIDPPNLQSSIVLLPMKRTVIAVEQDVVLQQEMVQAKPTAAIEATAENSDTEPVFFSLSDDGKSNTEQHVAPQEPTASQLETELSDGTVDTPCNTDAPCNIDASCGDEAFASQASEQVQPLALNEMAEAKPLETSLMDGLSGPKTNHFVTEPPSATEPQPVAGNVVTGPEATLHSRRYRPPVDVQSLPIAMESSSQNSTHSQIDSVVVSAPNLASEAVASKPVVTSLFLNRAQVRSLTVGAELHSVKISDKSVCQAFAAGPNQIKLIGTGNGTTRLVVYAMPSQGDSQPRFRSFDIHVKDAIEVTRSPATDRPDMLNQMIQQTFPSADVVVRKSGNELVVMGRCGSEAVAKKIVRLVRRTCLVPVKDELRVR